MKDFYFPHDKHSRFDNKIVLLRQKFGSAEGFGIYWLLVEEMYCSSDGYLDAGAYAVASFNCHLSEKQLSEFINYAVEIGAFIKDENARVTSKRVQEHFSFVETRTAARRRGAMVTNKKLHGTNAQASLKRRTTDAIINKTKQNKIKQKDNIMGQQISEVIKFFNETCGTNYKPNGKYSREVIGSRLKEGFSVNDCKKVIEFKNLQWKEDEKMKQYIRIETLFRPTKFEGYLNDPMMSKLDEMKRLESYKEEYSEYRKR